MPYTINPADENSPLDSDLARYAAGEFRALKGRVNALNGTQTTAAATAQTTANTAVTNAATAQGTANNALELAQLLGGNNFHTAITLTGAGNWTVPAGVTRVMAIIVGAGAVTGVLHVRAGDPTSPSSDFTHYCKLYAGLRNEALKVYAVTAGATIAYSCGAAPQVPPTASIGMGEGRFPYIAGLGGNTQFGADVVPPTLCTLAVRVANSADASVPASTVVVANWNSFDMSMRPTLPTFNDFYGNRYSISNVHTDSRVAGAAGYIQLLY